MELCRKEGGQTKHLQPKGKLGEHVPWFQKEEGKFDIPQRGQYVSEISLP